MNKSNNQKTKEWIKSSLPSLYTAINKLYMLLVHTRIRLWVHRNLLHDGIFIYDDELS